MDDYMGLDVSLKETAISVRRDGKRIWRGKCPSDPDRLSEVIRKRAPMAKRVVAEFPCVRAIASTVRRPVTANRNGWGAFAYADGRAYEGLSFDELEVFDRVGGGDSFAAGFLYGLLSGREVQWALDCGVASGALAMTTPGDAQQDTLAEIEGLMGGAHAGTVR